MKRRGFLSNSANVAAKLPNAMSAPQATTRAIGPDLKGQTDPIPTKVSMTMLTEEQQKMVTLFESHVGAELAGDLETTIATMAAEPYLNHVPTMAGGFGRASVYEFYRDHLVGSFFPPDVKMEGLSRTVGETTIVEEIYISFTHTKVVDWLLPRVAPTGKPVELVVCVVVGFKDGKVSHEHIYWDQASVLVQVGLLNPAGLPVGGVEVARRVRDPSLPARAY